jgi:hypothetical protein
MGPVSGACGAGVGWHAGRASRARRDGYGRQRARNRAGLSAQEDEAVPGQTAGESADADELRARSGGSTSRSASWRAGPHRLDQQKMLSISSAVTSWNGSSPDAAGAAGGGAGLLGIPGNCR